jgi:hypothetical protein
MFTVERTGAFGDWLDGLKDRRAVRASSAASNG